jgi:glycosyltransferase involved in cell wall biosynthesis
MTHILFICNTHCSFNGQTQSIYGLGGIETTVIELTNALAQLGYQVTAVTNSSEYSHQSGVEWRPLKDLHQIRADIAISCNDVRAFNHLKDTPSLRKIMWLHNPLAIEKAVRKNQLWPILRQRPELVCVGTYLYKNTSIFFPFKKRHIIGHGVSDEFLSASLLPYEARRPRAVWVSQKQRGLSYTLKIWSNAVLPAVPKAEFHLFGITSHDCQMTHNELQQKHIILHPRVTKKELAEFYKTACILLYPGAKDETFCLAAAEAQCMGLPVVTKGIGALSERVTHNYDGLIGKTKKAFSELAIVTLREADLWQRLSQGALEKRNSSSWKNSAHHWHNLIQESWKS